MASPPAEVRIIEPPKEAPLPPLLKIKPVVHPPAAPVVHTPRVNTPPIVVPTDLGNVAAPPVTVPTLTPTGVVSTPAASPTPVEASLAYRSAPLKFPPQALRQHMQGSVLLRVLVDETGKPMDVVIEKSSGYSLLDRSARAQVLASWSFQPALVNGRAVRAWARVPVTFDLHQL
jgi:protein TonB